jgi:hypothetical protein
MTSGGFAGEDALNAELSRVNTGDRSSERILSCVSRDGARARPCMPQALAIIAVLIVAHAHQSDEAGAGGREVKA